MSLRRAFLISVTASLGLGLVPAGLRAQRGSGVPATPAGLMAAVGAYVQRCYTSAQRVVARETVTLQPLRPDLSPDGFARRLEYELHVDWTPGPDGQPGEAEVHRTLLKVSGRAPRPKDEPGCSDPRAVSPEPLAMLLPARQAEFTFTGARPGKAGGRAVRIVNYRSTARGEPSVTWTDDCVSIDLPGRSVGQIWADPETGEVLRLDEHLVGTFEIRVPAAQQRKGASPTMTLERSDTSIRYKPVRFHEPDETVLMPSEVDSVLVVRNGGTPHLRIRQVFADYRRFLVEGRILLN